MFKDMEQFAGVQMELPMTAVQRNWMHKRMTEHRIHLSPDFVFTEMEEMTQLQELVYLAIYQCNRAFLYAALMLMEKSEFYVCDGKCGWQNFAKDCIRRLEEFERADEKDKK